MFPYTFDSKEAEFYVKVDQELLLNLHENSNKFYVILDNKMGIK